MHKLTNSGVHGVYINEEHRKLVEKLPTDVKLGCIKPGVNLSSGPKPLQFDKYFNAATISAPYPVSTNRRAKAAVSLAHMYLNNVYGDCVIAMMGHMFGLWSANDSDSGGEIVISDNDISSNYTTICGPGDNGCNFMSAINYANSTGFMINGKSYKIGYPLHSSYQGRSDLVKAAIYCFGATALAFYIPDGWISSSIWDASNYSWNPNNGHGVTLVDYDNGGVYVSSWGRIYYMTWAGFDCLPTLSATEHVIIVSPSWYGPNNKNSETGIDFTSLMDDINTIANLSQVPSIPFNTVGFTGTLNTADPKTLDINSGIILSGANMFNGTFKTGDNLYAYVQDGLIKDINSTPPPPPGTSYKFDFGTETSPVGTGYTKVTDKTVYSVALGYGWSEGVIYSDDRGIGTDISRDFCFTADGTFLVDLKSGNYSITAMMGDKGQYQHDLQGLYFHDKLFRSVTTDKGQVAIINQTVTVTNNQLVMRLKDLGGVDPNVVIESLEIVKVS